MIVLKEAWHILVPNKKLKRNQARQPADVDADVDSCSKTMTKYANSKEGDTQKY